jgi:excisionase family DNA binding protein
VAAIVADVINSSDGDGRTPGLEPRLLTLDDVATYLSVSVPQAYSLVRSGELRGIKIGGRGVWRVDRRELEAYVERVQKETEEWTKTHPLNPRDLQ